MIVSDDGSHLERHAGLGLRRLSWPCGAGRPEYRECFLDRIARREDRPYGSRPCGAAWRAYSEFGVAGRPSGWRAVGRSGGLSNCGGGELRSIRSAMRRLSLLSLPASSVSELTAGCVSCAGARLSMPVATTETRTIPSRLSSKDRTDDDVGVLVSLFANAGSSFVDLK